jgi:hypothetical protein
MPGAIFKRLFNKKTMPSTIPNVDKLLNKPITIRYVSKYTFTNVDPDQVFEKALKGKIN